MKMKIILASASPRRKSLMDVLGLEYEIKISDCDEIINENYDVKDIVMSLSLQKAKNVASRCNNNSIIIGADTVVSYGDLILGKPKSHDDAIEMLNLLSGKTHSVYTGFTIIRTSDYKTITDYEKTDVKFRKLSFNEIN